MMDSESESPSEYDESSNESEENSDVEAEQLRGIGEKRNCNRRELYEWPS